jgi:Arc/MetJ-type ribon-helix-helix transcriptional regulator
MEIELTPDQNALIEHAIQKGHYRSPQEAVNTAIAMWEERERARLELIEELEEADRSIDAGEGIYLESDEAIDEFIAGVKQRGRARLAQA